MSSEEIRTIIDNLIKEIAAQNGLRIPESREGLALVDDLGFSSLNVAALIANLEEALGIDPFQEEDVMITDIRTTDDLLRVYSASLAKTAG